MSTIRTRVCALTTFDDDPTSSLNNPFNPFTDYINWKKYDVSVLGLDTDSLLAAFTVTSEEMTDEEVNQAVDRAATEIISLFGGKIYKKVYKEPTKEELWLSQDD